VQQVVLEGVRGARPSCPARTGGCGVRRGGLTVQRLPGPRRYLEIPTEVALLIAVPTWGTTPRIRRRHPRIDEFAFRLARKRMTNHPRGARCSWWR